MLFDVFLVLKPHVLQGDMYFILKTGTFQSALLFTSTISDPMTVNIFGRNWGAPMTVT
jgi:hypothetical protein